MKASLKTIGYVFVVSSLTLTSCGPQQGKFTTRAETSSTEIFDPHGGKRLRPKYVEMAHGRPIDGTFKPAVQAPWPFPVLSIGHTMASYQNYGGEPYFHHGLDIRQDAGTPVLASRGGKVVNVENYNPGSAYWEVAILDADGYLWQYHHIDRETIPEEIIKAFETGGSINDGTKIGEIYYWSVTTYGERYHHVHLNVLAAGGIYQNPFAFLQPLPDNQPPQIIEIGLLKNGRRVTGNSVQPPYSIFAKVHDLILHQKFVVPANEISYSINGSAAKTVWRFDQLPGGASREKDVEVFFVKSLTCGDYTCRNLVVDLGYQKGRAEVFPAATGKYSITVNAQDFVGNKTEKTYDFEVIK